MAQYEHIHARFQKDHIYNQHARRDNFEMCLLYLSIYASLSNPKI